MRENSVIIYVIIYLLLLIEVDYQLAKRGVFMPQVSLYIENEVLDSARRSARFENISLSKYVSRVLARSMKQGWPEGYWELFGALGDDSFVCPEDTPFDRVSEQVSFS